MTGTVGLVDYTNEDDMKYAVSLFLVPVFQYHGYILTAVSF